MIDIPLYIRYAKIAQVKDTVKIANQNAFQGRTTVPDYTRLLEIVRKSVEFMYANNPSNPTLEGVANYMYNLSGKRSLTPTVSASPFVVIVQPQSQTINSGSNVSFSVAVAGGTPTYTYIWSYNGNPIMGATNSTYTIIGATSGNAGTYTVKITDSNGLVLNSVPAILTVNTPIIIGSVWYGDTDPNADLQSHIDNFVYLYTFGFTHNANLIVPLEQAGANNKYYVIRVPSTESDKTIWFNTVLNNGNIPDAVWQNLITFGGFDYYYTRVAASFDYNVTLNLS